MKQCYSRRIMGLIVVVIILTSIPYSARADVIMTLVALGGSMGNDRGDTFGTIFGRPGFILTGGDRDRSGISGGFPLSGLSPIPGQLVDQRGGVGLFGSLASINGQLCCSLSGGLNVSAIPSMSASSNNFLDVSAPFTARGILHAGPSERPSEDHGPFGDYFIEGVGTMSSGFEATAMCGNTPCNFSWRSTLMTFTAPTPSTVPEPSTWLLLASGLVGLGAIRRRFVN